MAKAKEEQHYLQSLKSVRVIRVSFPLPYRCHFEEFFQV